MEYDLSPVLSTITASSATFIAIIGGLVANKAISNFAEKESIEHQIELNDSELEFSQNRFEELSKIVCEMDAEDYIRDNLEDLIQCKSLSEIYDKTADTFISFDELLPYWDKAIDAVKIYTKLYQNSLGNLERTSDSVPIELINKLDSFQYRICRDYHAEIENQAVSFLGPIAFVASATISNNVEERNANLVEMKKLEEEMERIQLKNEILDHRLDILGRGRAVTRDLKYFVALLIINIVIPVIFMLFNPTDSLLWYRIESIVSVVLFAIGLIYMVKYLYSLFFSKGD